MLVQCAWAAKRKEDSYYRALFFRLQSRRGPQKAICALAASMLTAIYHILRDGSEHHDLGAAYFDRRPVELKVNRQGARQEGILGSVLRGVVTPPRQCMCHPGARIQLATGLSRTREKPTSMPTAPKNATLAAARKASSNAGSAKSAGPNSQ
jgi:hypothetical protein